MALKQSPWALGSNQSKRPQTSGALHVQRFIYDLSVAANAAAINDIIEIGELPPFCRIIDAKVYTNGTFTGVTADVGIMSGEYGDNDPTRTVGAELYTAVDLTVMTRLVKSDSLKIAPTESSRGIGVKILGAAASVAATKYIVLELHYTQ